MFMNKITTTYTFLSYLFESQFISKHVMLYTIVNFAILFIETPLTSAVQLEKPYEMIMALVAGGAHLDYRASDSMTPIHRAAVKGNYEAIKVNSNW
ncbi:unnamed protein product [Trichobilharzia regenti]|nr:unnamed protein product [Trichobilharzia regenti]